MIDDLFLIRYIRRMITIRQSPEFAAWLANLRDREARLRIQSRIARMEFGGLGDCKPIGGGVSEARIHYGQGYRLYFVQRGAALIILLAGGDKSSQNKDIAKAITLAQTI